MQTNYPPTIELEGDRWNAAITFRFTRMARNGRLGIYTAETAEARHPNALVQFDAEAEEFFILALTNLERTEEL